MKEKKIKQVKKRTPKRNKTYHGSVKIKMPLLFTLL